MRKNASPCHDIKHLGSATCRAISFHVLAVLRVTDSRTQVPFKALPYAKVIALFCSRVAGRIFRKTSRRTAHIKHLGRAPPQKEGRGPHEIENMAFRIKPDGYTVAAGARAIRAPREPARQAAKKPSLKPLPQSRWAAIARHSEFARTWAGLAAAPTARSTATAAVRPHEATTLGLAAEHQSRWPRPSTPPARSLAACQMIERRRQGSPFPRAQSLGASPAPPAPQHPPRTASGTLRQAAASKAALGSGPQRKKQRRPRCSKIPGSRATATSAPSKPWQRERERCHQSNHEGGLYGARNNAKSLQRQ